MQFASIFPHSFFFFYLPYQKEGISEEFQEPCFEYSIEIKTILSSDSSSATDAGTLGSQVFLFW